MPQNLAISIELIPSYLVKKKSENNTLPYNHLHKKQQHKTEKYKEPPQKHNVAINKALTSFTNTFAINANKIHHFWRNINHELTWICIIKIVTLAGVDGSWVKHWRDSCKQKHFISISANLDFREQSLILYISKTYKPCATRYFIGCLYRLLAFSSITFPFRIMCGLCITSHHKFSFKVLSHLMTIFLYWKK